MQAIHIGERISADDEDKKTENAIKSRLAEEFESLEVLDSRQHLYSRKEGRRPENAKKNR